MTIERHEGSSGLRLPSLPDRLPLLERLLAEAIEIPVVQAYRKRAHFTFFCGYRPDELAGYDAQLEAVGRCLEWFVFDYRIAELDQTPAEHWFELNEEHFTPDDHLLAHRCLEFILGLFEVMHVEPHQGLWLTDLLREQPTYVRESHLSAEVREGQLLLGRLFPFQDIYCLSGMATVMPQEATDDVKRLLSQMSTDRYSLIEGLDGIELENLFGRTLSQIDRCEDLGLLHERMSQFLATVGPAEMSFSTYLDRINRSADAFDVVSRLEAAIPITCPHELALITSLVTATWFATHKP